MHAGAAGTLGSDSEEEDYMSAAFLETEAAAKAPETYAERRRKRILEQEAKGRIAPLREREKEARDSGLAAPIPKDNVGFRLLEKMGYKSGMALGKPAPESPPPESARTPSTDPEFERPSFRQAESSGDDEDRATPGPRPALDDRGRLLEPIPIAMVEKRTGLGLQAVTEKRKREHEEADSRKKAALERDFQASRRQQFEDKRVRGEVEAMRRELRALDEKNGIDAGEMWPEVKVPVPDGAEAAEEGLHATALSKEEIIGLDGEDGNSEAAEGQDGEPPFSALEPVVQREKLIKHLRTQYHFCHYCGVECANAEELAQDCPGEDREDHE
ncbi:hypothetical protein DFJ74DRAFT_496585 [Hyaloraphidium curvatum]|nr:hypothetical protein DFJ74DRAFT_496585 [Hyaloraphidium curvatum]